MVEVVEPDSLVPEEPIVVVRSYTFPVVPVSLLLFCTNTVAVCPRTLLIKNKFAINNIIANTPDLRTNVLIKEVLILVVPITVSPALLLRVAGIRPEWAIGLSL